MGVITQLLTYIWDRLVFQIEPIFIALIRHAKIGIHCSPWAPIDLHQIYAESVNSLRRDAMNSVITKPKLSLKVTEASLVIRPSSKKVNRAIVTTLYDLPQNEIADVSFLCQYEINTLKAEGMVP